MTKSPPDRITISIPSDAEIDKQEIEELVDQSDAESVSEFIRRLVAESSS